MKVISAKDAAVLARVSALTWMTSAEAAIYCRVSISTFYEMVRERSIPFSCPAGPNGDRRFHIEDLDKAMRSGVQNLPPAA